MKTYLERIKVRRKILNYIHRKNLKKEAFRLVQLLKSAGFKFERIYLSGSIIRNKPLSESSDIDLIIKGLQGRMFYKAYALLLKNSKFPVDLKPFEDLDEIFRKKIEKEGKIL